MVEEIMDRWIHINKHVFEPVERPLMAKCPVCGAKSIPTGKNYIGKKQKVEIAGIKVVQWWMRNLMRPARDENDPQYQSDYLKLWGWLMEEGYEPQSAKCVVIVERKEG